MADLKKIVRLYYLGGLESKAKKGRVVAEGNVLTLPEAGDYIEMPLRVANQIMGRHKYLADDGTYVSLFTLDGRVAKRVKDGMSYREAQNTGAAPLNAVTDAVLMEELKRRGLLDDAVVEEVPAKTAAKTPAKAHKPAARRSKEKPDTETNLSKLAGLDDEEEK